MDQHQPRACSRHRKLGGNGPQCFSMCLAECAEAAAVIVAPTPKVERKAKIVPVVTNTGTSSYERCRQGHDQRGPSVSLAEQAGCGRAPRSGQGADEGLAGTSEGRESGGLVSDNPSGI